MLFPKELSVTFNAVVEIREWIYFSANNFNGLFKYNKFTSEMIHLGIFKDEPVLLCNIHQKAFLWNGKIIFVPLTGKNIAIFDLETEEIEYIRLFDQDNTTGVDCTLYGDVLWIIYSKDDHFVVKYNLKDHECIHIKKPEAQLYNISARNCATKFFCKGAVYERYLYAPVWNSNQVVRFDMGSEEYQFINTEINNLLITSIAVDNNFIYLSNQNDHTIYRYDINKASVDTYVCEVEYKSKKRIVYPIIVSTDKGILFFAQDTNSILCIENGKVISFCEYPEEFRMIDSDVRKNWRRFFSYDHRDGKIIVYPYSTNMELIVDTKSRTCGYNRIIYDRNYIEKLFDTVYKRAYFTEGIEKKIFNENDIFGLKDFITEIGH